MNFIAETLNWISMGLMLPVMVLLLIAMLAAVTALGGFASNAFAICRERRKSRELMEWCRNGALPAGAGKGAFETHVMKMAAMNWNGLECEKFICDLRAGYERELERARFMTKIGPMLGLMGTLIPMGPALAGLASGDIGSMAYNMQIAFATTVVGCFIAGVGLMIYSVRKHWYAEEISNLFYLLELHRGDAA